MSTLFARTTLGGIELGNRLVRSATWEGLADADGGVTPELLELYARLADGGVGLIVSSYLYVDRVGKQLLGQIGADDDRLVPGLERLAAAVHEHGGRLVGQLVHCGGQADREYNGGVRPVAPSAVSSPGYPEVPRALSEAEVAAVAESFAAAARRLRAAGFDGAQLHGAHGYLLAQFLSPLRNRRSDRYGGSLANRARFCLEVFAAVRGAVGDRFPILIKLNANDFLDGSTTEADAAYLAAALARAGVAAIEVSGGTPGSGRLGAARPDIATRADEAYFRPQAEAIRAAAPGTPLILVGGLRSYEVAEEVVESGVADYVAMARPLIREPDLPARWARGECGRAACVSCRGCFGPGRRGEGIRCVQLDP